MGKRLLEERSLYFPGGKEGIVNPANVPLPPKKQKIDAAKGPEGRKEGDIIANPTNQRDPYLSYEQYENLLYRGGTITFFILL